MGHLFRAREIEMQPNDEIEAMRVIAEALSGLDEDARNRALQWAISRFRSSAAPMVNLSRSIIGVSDRIDSPSDFETFAELFEAARPSTDREKALVAAYWAHLHEAQQSFVSQLLNTALKDLGHGVSNITDSLSALKNERPALILQLKKSGTSQQARKTYKLTQEGVKRVRLMIEEAASVNNG